MMYIWPESENGLRKGLLFCGDLKNKNTGGILIIIGRLCTHAANTHLC